MESSSTNKVGLFLVGSRKSGTTSLANFLGGHNEISLCNIKEPNHFNNISVKSIDNYHSMFDWNKNIQLDASTGYTSNLNNTKNICEAIYAYNPKAKVIYTIREPLERIRSHYRMSYERGDLNTSLNEALRSHKLLLDCSRYYSQISVFIHIFGKENVLILKSEELNKCETEKSIIYFLNLTRPFEKQIGVDNTANTDYRMPRSIDRILTNKLYAIIKSMFPKCIVTFVKSNYYKAKNKNLSMKLNLESKKVLKKELIPEIDKLQTIVDFDVSNWTEKLNIL